MKKFGVKLWSKDFIKNLSFAQQAIKALKDGHFGYIELFVTPDSFESTKDIVCRHLQGLDVIIHAPHSVFGLDTGNKDALTENLHKLKDSQRFADVLNAPIIILHSGMREGEEYINETIRQFKLINDSRLALENLPAICSSTNQMLHGTSPKQIEQIIAATKCQFCLDFSHAICSSNYYKRDVWADLEAYKALKPNMYHLCDGDIKSDVDEHRHYGEGDYDLGRILRDYTDDNALITMETGHGIPTAITPWLDDINYLKNLMS